jgi:thiosulfate dehydrogenase [quinone] large subunit
MDSKYPRLVTHQQRALAIIRIFVGLWFLYAVSSKLAPTWVAGFQHEMVAMAAAHPPAFYESFLKELVIPNAATFAYLVILGEMTVGLGLVLGLFTAPCCVIGIFLNLNFLLATASGGPAGVGLNLVFIVVQFALALGYAGTTWGLDRALIEKMPWWGQGLLHYEYREF